MAKKFIALLGTTDYLPANYVLNGTKVENVRFVEEAIAQLLCEAWGKDDEIIVALTPDARKKNWEDDGHKSRDGRALTREGLKRRLNNFNFSAQIKAVDIETGNNEDEIWSIFEALYKNIDEGDSVIFDITHGFRSLPMLAMVILNYARVLKNITIEGIYYGAFEVLGQAYEVKEMELKNRNAPIFDLTSFMTLFEWTSAINSFMKYGIAEDIGSLTNAQIKHILKKLKEGGKSPAPAENIRDISKKINQISQYLQTCRGPKIKGFNFDKLQKNIANAKGDVIKPLTPLFDKIVEKISSFKQDSFNTDAAAEWCSRHNMIQQGFTFLQETKISEILQRVDSEDTLLNRKLVFQAVIIKQRDIPQCNWRRPASEKRPFVQSVIDNMTQEECHMIYEVSKYRNDLNHCGFAPEEERSFSDFRQYLNQYIDEAENNE